MRAWHHAQAAIVLVTAVNRHPGRDTSARIHTQVKLILMQRLSARPWRLEVEHRLYCEGLPPQDMGQPVVEALIDHPLQTRFVPAMGLHNPRVQGERIRRIRDVVRIAPMLLVNHQEMLPQALYFVQRKQTARHGVSLRCELVEGNLQESPYLNPFIYITQFILAKNQPVGESTWFGSLNNLLIRRRLGAILTQDDHTR